jgi:hypothetical protein
MEARFGKMPTTSVRRRTSLLRRSWGLLDQTWLREADLALLTGIDRPEQPGDLVSGYRIGTESRRIPAVGLPVIGLLAWDYRFRRRHQVVAFLRVQAHRHNAVGDTDDFAGIEGAVRRVAGDDSSGNCLGLSCGAA